MTKFNITTVVASAMIAGTLMTGASYAASAVIVPNDNPVTCGSNSTDSACGDTQMQQGRYEIKSLAGSGDDDDDAHESGRHESGGHDGSGHDGGEHESGGHDGGEHDGDDD
jgi:hypothetical protein